MEYKLTRRCKQEYLTAHYIILLQYTTVVVALHAVCAGPQGQSNASLQDVKANVDKTCLKLTKRNRSALDLGLFLGCNQQGRCTLNKQSHCTRQT
jgi:hypothetical protein